MPLIGTAGHVDHGKSTLILALSGKDPDRWDEEKRRGLTIDLGFAWTDLGTGSEVSFVDVPGHERYLKNMLAGIEVIDIALFVVAADEGWKPQSEEHLAVLDLLEVDAGVVALSKIDLVDPDIVDLRCSEIESQLSGTSLEGSPVIPVSAPGGTGLSELRSALAGLAAVVSHPDRSPRLWIDRSFSIAGVGTVVTGSLLEGSLRVGDTLEIYPSGLRARVRSIQRHERDVTLAEPGNRIALGLSGVSRDQAVRGDMVGVPGEWRSSSRFSAKVRTAPYLRELTERGSYQLHIGSAAHSARIQRTIDDVAVIELGTEVPLRMGDRFIIRDTGRRLVVAGGQVLDPAPGSIGRAITAAAGYDPNQNPDRLASQLLDARGHDSLDNLRRDTGGGVAVDGIVIGNRVFMQKTLDALVVRAGEMVTAEQKARPMRSGLPLATLASELRVGPDVAEEIVRRSETLRLSGPDVATTDHKPKRDDRSDIDWSMARQALESGLDVPTVGELGLTTELLHLLVREGELVRISENLVYLPAQVDRIKDSIRELGSPFGVGDAKEKLQLSRKYIVPILEWLDAQRITVRSGNERRIN